MSTEVTDYIAELPEPERARIAELYARVRELVSEAEEGRSYNMPALMYRGKGLFSAMLTKHHIGVYPYGNLGELAAEVTAAGLESTKGSIHLRAGETLPDELLARFVARRVAQIDAAAAR